MTAPIAALVRDAARRAVEVALAGGASQFLVHLTGQVPARVRIAGGASM